MAWLTCWRDSKKETGLAECTWRQRHKPTSAVWSRAHRHAHTQPVSWESTTRIVLLLVLHRRRTLYRANKAGVLPEWPLTLKRAKCTFRQWSRVSELPHNADHFAETTHPVAIFYFPQGCKLNRSLTQRENAQVYKAMQFRIDVNRRKKKIEAM